MASRALAVSPVRTRSRIPQPESPQFVIFLNILYSEDVKEGNLVSKLFSKSYYKSKIVKELESVAMEFKGYTTLLSELSRVRRTHVEDWLIETNLAELIQYVNDVGQADLFQTALM